MRTEILEKIKGIIEKNFPDIDVATVTEETKLIEDLGFDSLSLMMMSMEIEDVFGFKFREFVKFETISDACDYLEARV